MELAKECDFVLCQMYSEYIRRRKNGDLRQDAGKFSSSEYLQETLLQTMPEPDISDCLCSLAKSGMVEMNIIGEIEMTDKSIIYMENRFPDGLGQVLDWMGKIKSAIPFI